MNPTRILKIQIQIRILLCHHRRRRQPTLQVLRSLQILSVKASSPLILSRLRRVFKCKQPVQTLQASL
jgi:hypothetical protein